MSGGEIPDGSDLIPLPMLRPGVDATLVEIRGGSGLGRRLADMGLVPGVQVRLVAAGPRGPLVIAAGDTRLALGRGMAQKIMVR